MTTTDPFTEAARAEAERYFADPGVDPLTLSVIDHAMHMAEWARTHLTATLTANDSQSDSEPTDAECIYVLNIVCSPFGEEDKESEWAPAAIQRCREAMVRARAARRDEEKR